MKAMEVFNSSHSSTIEIQSAGEKVMYVLYNSKYGETLNQHRYKRFCEKLSTSLAHVQPHVLPPTAAATN